jgi:methyl-accepting chemotaxis protein
MAISLHSLQDHVLGLLSRFKISHKIWTGFGLLTGILILVSVISVRSLNDARNKLDRVVNDSQPTVVLSLQLADVLDRTNAALGFYLLSKEGRDRKEYEANLARLDEYLGKLESMPDVSNNDAIKAHMAAIRHDIDTYKGYRQRMLELAKDENRNMPGIGFSATAMAPVAADIQQALSQMLVAELDEEATAERKELLFELSDLRQKWMNILINNRAFIAFRAPSSVENLKLYRSGFTEQVNRLLKLGDDVLNFDEAEALATIKDRMQPYFRMQDELVKVHSSEKWRTDSYLIRTEIGPLVNKIKHSLDDMIQRELKQAETISQSLLAEVEQTRNLVLSLAIAGLLVGVLGGMLMVVLVIRPLCNTVHAMRDIAEGEGDLTRRLPVRGKDEIAELSGAFNKFVEKVQALVRQVAGSTTQLAAAAE